VAFAGLFGPDLHAQVVYTYDNVSSAAVANNSCGSPVDRSFFVSESFTVGGGGSISIGVDIDHARRRDLQIDLIAPDGTSTVRLASSAGTGGDENDNYRVTFTSNADAGNVLNDGTNDLTVAAGLIRYRRLVTVSGLDSFYSGSAAGEWILRMCDVRGGSSGTFNSARLVLRDDSSSAPQVCASQSAFEWSDNGDGATFVSAAVAPDGVLLSQTSITGDPAGDSSGFESFTTRAFTTGNHTGYYFYGMDLPDGGDESGVESTLFGFSTPVSGLEFALMDVDFGGWEDYVKVEASGPFGRVPYELSFDGATQLAYAGEWAEADSTVANNEVRGNARYRFLGPVSTVRTVYAQGNEPTPNPNFQFVGLSDFSFCTYDYGDGPSSYGTLAADNGPRHGLQNREALFIGAAPADGETEALVSAGANGDDSSLNNDEAGAIVFPPARLPNEGWVCGPYTTDPTTNAYCVTVTVSNNSGGAAQLVGWIDFNNNGVFDAGERSLPDLQSMSATGFGSGNIPNGSNGFQAVLVFDPPGNDPIPNNATPSMARLRLTTDPLFFSDGTPPSHLGTVSDGEVQDHAIPVNTLPVTLAGFSAARLDPARLAVRWSVATEAGTLGYRLLQGESGTELARIGTELVASQAVSTVLPQYYESIVDTRSNAPLYLEELSAHGRLERFGPFAVGEVKGEMLEFTEQPWVQAAQERADADVTRQAGVRSRRDVEPIQAEILVDQSGVQRVALAQLHALGLDLLGRDPALLRLTHGGIELPLAIDGDGTLSAGNHLLFYAEAVEGSQYTRTRPYALDLGGGALRWQTESAAPVAGLAAARMSRQFALKEDRAYNFSAPTDDPWFFDTVQRNGASGGKSWQLSLPADVAGPATLMLDLWGGIDYPGTADDHRFALSLNGTVLGEYAFDGVVSRQFSVPLGTALLSGGVNEVRIDLLPTGNQVDILRIESIAISVEAGIDAEAARTGINSSVLRPVSDGISRGSFEDSEPAVACGSACGQFRVDGLAQQELIALRVGAAGVTRLVDLDVQAADVGWSAVLRPAGLEQTSDGMPGESDRIVLLAANEALQPALRLAAVSEHPLAGGAAELIAIAPFRFVAGIEPLLQARRSEGLSARVVDVAEIYQHYSAGVVDPLAIRDFLRDAHASLETRYVLLVGGDTYDYFDRLGTGSISDVPTIYGRTHPVVNHSPLDHVYADVDDDGAPEMAVGRLPVRTDAELAFLIDKILSYPNGLGVSSVFAAERANPAEGADYSAEADLIIAGLDPLWQQNVTRVYLDDYPAGSSGVAAARNDLRSAINAGRALVTYYGHGSPTVWSREQLLQSAQLNAILGNAGAAPIVTEFGCWGGYFVAPQFNSMSHGWLNAGNRGAAAMLASSSLTEHDSDRAMAATLLPGLGESGIRIGDAMLQAKRTLMLSEPERRDVVYGLTLFGDPSMRVSD
jgi:subtilisin-like proprotein convertase family protein/uncharacterized protein YciI